MRALIIGLSAFCYAASVMFLGAGIAVPQRSPRGKPSSPAREGGQTAPAAESTLEGLAREQAVDLEATTGVGRPHASQMSRTKRTSLAERTNESATWSTP